MIHVLWDASDIWGPLAIYGLRGLGVPFTVVRGSAIATGALTQEHASLLLVPGGFSRHKGNALGETGRACIRDFVADGGAYLGFCGGASLALTGEHALGLCPWHRAGYANRIQHYMSGHIHVSMDPDARPATCALRADAPLGDMCAGKAVSARPLLPIWWPGRFASQEDDGVSVLARYAEPGPDFWLADLPVAELPPAVFANWEKQYGFSPSPSFLQGEPCVIEGRFGKGRYLLSYSHLETPRSPDANAWLACILHSLGREKPLHSLIPQWDLETMQPAWPESDLLSLWRKLSSVLDAGKAAGLFFRRSPWLLGWRTGLPGAVCNTVRARLHTILSLPPSPEAAGYWEKTRTAFVPAFHAFADRAISYLLAERLAMTLAKDLPDTLTPETLLAERAAVFGPSGMTAHTGGMLGPLLAVLDELAFLQVCK